MESGTPGKTMKTQGLNRRVRLAPLAALTILTASLSILTLPVHAEIYKWVDAQGNVHFGDKPKDNKSAAGAESVELRNGYTPTTLSQEEQVADDNQRRATKQRLEARREAEEKRSSESQALKAEKKAGQCAADKKKLRAITEVSMGKNGPSIYYLSNDDGSAMTVTQQKAAIAALREKIARDC